MMRRAVRPRCRSVRLRLASGQRPGRCDRELAEPVYQVSSPVEDQATFTMVLWPSTLRAHSSQRSRAAAKEAGGFRWSKKIRWRE